MISKAPSLSAVPCFWNRNNPYKRGGDKSREDLKGREMGRDESKQ